MTSTGTFAIRTAGAALAAGVVLTACAIPPADDAEARAELAAINDPLEPFNRAMFEFNRAVDRVLLGTGGPGLSWGRSRLRPDDGDELSQ